MAAIHDVGVAMASTSQINLQLSGSDPTSLRIRICNEVTRQCLEQYPQTLQGLLLTGSMARNEGSVIRDVDGRTRVLGDVEVLMVFNQYTRLPSRLEIARLQTISEGNLVRAGVICRISLSPVHRDYLRELPKHIFTYELLKSGQVIWGDTALLEQIPAFSASDICREDAYRLLCNRMVEQLEMASEVRVERDVLPPALLYSTIKLYLDMATSFLVFVGCYEPTYRRRAERLAALAANKSNQEYPFELGDFSRRVTACTVKKLNSNVDNNDLGWPFFEVAIHFARLLWRWELARLTGLEAQQSNRQLLERWRTTQPVRQRLRGWAYVARKQGWGSCRYWPRWARRAWRGSPRYWIYAATAEVFFRLPCILKPEGLRMPGDKDWARLQKFLPALSGAAVARPDWSQLGLQIAWNYHRFLTGTRA